MALVGSDGGQLKLAAGAVARSVDDHTRCNRLHGVQDCDKRFASTVSHARHAQRDARSGDGMCVGMGMEDGVAMVVAVGG